MIEIRGSVDKKRKGWVEGVNRRDMAKVKRGNVGADLEGSK